MAGGKSTPKKDQALKVASGELVKTGQIMVRGIPVYKAGVNVAGLGTLYALCSGKVFFRHKKTSHGKVRTFIGVIPNKEKAVK